MPTLRTRLMVAFLAVVLGPVLLGGAAIATSAAAIGDAHATDRLDLASTAAREAMDSLCRALRAGAISAALAGPPAARQVVADGLANAVLLADNSGTTTASSGQLPARPWARCDQTNPPRDYTALAARVELHDDNGSIIGYAEAFRPVDNHLIDRIAAAAGTSVTLLGTSAPTNPMSTEPPDQAKQIATLASTLAASTIGHTTDGRYVRRLDSTAGQPLPLALSVPRPGPGRLWLALVALILLGAIGGTVVAWWLARGTTRPLTELAEAAGRVGGGDLSARVPVRTRDEVGRLACTLNRMAKGMRDYLTALSASRDQLRRHLEVLGDTLSSTHDLDRILAVIVASAQTTMGARAGVVLLVEKETLIGDGIRIALGDGLLGSVAATGQPRLGRVERDGPQLAEAEPRCHTYIAVPLTSTGSDASDASNATVRGVLALYDRIGEDEFDERDLDTLRTFAGRAAIAVHNVRLHEEARRLSHTDGLTGLYNYRTLRDSLRREVERASRFGHRLCVLLLDLDRFKDVNDTHGHAAGDAVLVEFARRVRDEIREVDLAFRHGGEEFLVLLPETDAAGGEVVAQRLLSAVRSSTVRVPGRSRTPAARTGMPRQHPTGEVPVTVSIGVAVFPDHGRNGSAVLDAADDALYAAKAAGRDTYRLAVAVPGPSAPRVPSARDESD